MGRGAKTWHAGEAELVETVWIKVRGGGEAVWMGGAMYGTGDVAAECDEEFVYCGELLWCTDVKGDGAGIEVVLGDIMGVSDVIETLCHFCGEDEGGGWGGGGGGKRGRTGIVGRGDLSFFDVCEKVVDGMVMGALVAGVGDGLVPVGIPRGDLVVEEEVIGIARDVARGVLVRVGGCTDGDGGRSGAGEGEGGRKRGCCGRSDGEGLVECALVWKRVAADTGDVSGVVYGDGF